MKRLIIVKNAQSLSTISNFIQDLLIFYLFNETSSLLVQDFLMFMLTELQRFRMKSLR